MDMRISKAKTPLLVIIIGAAESTRAASKSPQVAGLLGETLTTIVTRLMKEERELIPLFYRSGVILGALNWIWWIVVEKRVFENSASVLDRLDTLLRQWEEL